MPLIAREVPHFSPEEAVAIAFELFAIDGAPEPLPSDRDQNFRLRSSSGEDYILKISNASEQRAALEAQNAAMRHVARHDPTIRCPRVCRTTSGDEIATIEGRDGQQHRVRLLAHVPGVPLAAARPHDAELLRGVGQLLGRLDRVLESFSHPGARRPLDWDLRHAASVVRRHVEHVSDPSQRALLARSAERFESTAVPVLARSRTSVIHNDGNEHNVIIELAGSGAATPVGIVDFGDLVETHTVIEAAVAAAYVILDTPTLLAPATHVAAGYHEIHPLSDLERGLLYDLIVMRLCVSVAIGAQQVSENPSNEYLAISQRAAWSTLEQLARVDQDSARDLFRRGDGAPAKGPAGSGMSRDEILALRRRHVGKSLSVAYSEPLKIVRGYMQYLYDETGRAYLDVVNNVCHVGHCHPRVVRAAQEQIAVLNTNTRYLHDHLVQYAERLCATFPEPLSVCFLVCSGSEANELALRLARTHTGRRDVIVVDGAYHGSTSALIDISPYKHNGPGGSGPPPWVHQVPTPHRYRGPHRDEATAGDAYARYVREAIEGAERSGRGIAAFFCESLMSCAGQIVLPEGFLREAYRHAREAGAVCVADEVQVGFGRVGTHFWGFETQGVVPDIVTLGKPIGNGHPLAAVITTPEIAESFANGMEYFNTFGGNPVSCAVGMAVLDVIEEEGLQKNARTVGARFMAGLQSLAKKHEPIGAVRGMGLFLGIELVRDRETLAPATRLAGQVVDAMKERGILTSTDGPLDNVIKIKPPMVFSEANAAEFVQVLDEVLTPAV